MSFDLLKALKKAEPLGFLASLSLVISTFTFDGAGNMYKIYGYSVVSAFMFIFSFVFSIFNQYSMSSESKNPIIIIMRVLTNFGIYFFLSIGVIFLILIAIQFGQEQTQILTITSGFLGTFLIFIFIIYYPKRLRKALKQRGEFGYHALDIGFVLVGILVASVSIIFIVEAIVEIEDLSERYLIFLYTSIGPFLGFYMGALLLLYQIDHIRQSKGPLDKVESIGIISVSVLAVSLIMASLYALVND